MPKLTAPDDLLSLATPLWQRLAPAWSVEILRVAAAEIDGAYGQTCANTTTSKATIKLDASLIGRDLEETLAHEMAHVNAWAVTELLDHGDARAVALFEPMIERFGLAAIGAPARSRAVARMRAHPAAGAARDGANMDGSAVLEAVKSQDGAAALTILDGWLVELIKGAAGEAGMPAEDAAPIEGEAPAAMMRRVLRSALARKSSQPDTLGPRVLARLRVTDPAAAMMAIEAGDAAVTQLPALRARIATLEGETAAASKAADLAKREARMRRAITLGALNRAQGFDITIENVLDATGKEVERERLTLSDAWAGGSYEDLDRQLAKLEAGATGGKSRVSPDPERVEGAEEIPARTREYAKDRGITDPKKIARLARNMGGAKPQEQNR